MALTIDLFISAEKDPRPGVRIVWTHVHDSRHNAFMGVFRYTLHYLHDMPGSEGADEPVDASSFMGAHMWAIAVERTSTVFAQGGQHLSASLLRELPISTWEIASRERLATAIRDEGFNALIRQVPEEVVKLPGQGLPASPEMVEASAVSLVEAMFPGIDENTPGGRRRRESLLKQARAAVLYTHLIGEGVTDPAEKIAQRYGATPGAARTWIHRARQSGFLGKAIGPTAGQRRDGEPPRT